MPPVWNVTAPGIKAHGRLIIIDKMRPINCKCVTNFSFQLLMLDIGYTSDNECLNGDVKIGRPLQTTHGEGRRRVPGVKHRSPGGVPTSLRRPDGTGKGASNLDWKSLESELSRTFCDDV